MFTQLKSSRACDLPIEHAESLHIDYFVLLDTELFEFPTFKVANVEVTFQSAPIDWRGSLEP